MKRSLILETDCDGHPAVHMLEKAIMAAFPKSSLGCPPTSPDGCTVVGTITDGTVKGRTTFMERGDKEIAFEFEDETEGALDLLWPKIKEAYESQVYGEGWTYTLGVREA